MDRVAGAAKPLLVQRAPHLVSPRGAVHVRRVRVGLHAGEHGERDIGERRHALHRSRRLDPYRFADFLGLCTGRQRLEHRVEGRAKRTRIRAVDAPKLLHLALVRPIHEHEPRDIGRIERGVEPDKQSAVGSSYEDERRPQRQAAEQLVQIAGGVTRAVAVGAGGARVGAAKARARIEDDARELSGRGRDRQPGIQRVGEADFEHDGRRAGAHARDVEVPAANVHALVLLSREERRTEQQPYGSATHAGNFNRARSALQGNDRVLLGVPSGATMLNDMGTFRVDIEVENPARPGQKRTLPSVLVDTGAELSWVPTELLESLGVERWTGTVSVYVAGKRAGDEVVFGEPGDLALLGSRTLEGLNFRVEPVTKQLVDAGPAPAAVSHLVAVLDDGALMSR